MKVQNNFIAKNEQLLFGLLLLAYFIGYLYPLLFTACKDVQMASVFSPDEGRYVHLIRGALEAKSFRLHFVSYGHFYFNLVLLPLMLLQSFFVITDVHILLSLRGVSWLFGLGSAWMTYVLTKRFFGVFEAWLSAVLLVFVPLTFLEYSVIAHPDTLQLFFILASLYAICSLSEKLSVRHLMWASAMAGLAFSAKYGGILLLPLIAFVFLRQVYQAEGLQCSMILKKRVNLQLILLTVLCLIAALLLQQSVVNWFFSSDGHIESAWIWDLITKVRFLLLGISMALATISYFSYKKLFNPKYDKSYFGFYYGMLASLLFVAMFVLTSPNSLLELQFVQGLLYEGHNTRTGGFFTADWQKISTQWYEVLTSKHLLGGVLFLLSLSASLWYLLRKIK